MGFHMKIWCFLMCELGSNGDDIWDLDHLWDLQQDAAQHLQRLFWKTCLIPPQPKTGSHIASDPDTQQVSMISQNLARHMKFTHIEFNNVQHRTSKKDGHRMPQHGLFAPWFLFVAAPGFRLLRPLGHLFPAIGVTGWIWSPGDCTANRLRLSLRVSSRLKMYRSWRKMMEEQLMKSPAMDPQIQESYRFYKLPWRRCLECCLSSFRLSDSNVVWSCIIWVNLRRP